MLLRQPTLSASLCPTAKIEKGYRESEECLRGDRLGNALTAIEPWATWHMNQRGASVARSILDCSSPLSSVAFYAKVMGPRTRIHPLSIPLSASKLQMTGAAQGVVEFRRRSSSSLESASFHIDNEGRRTGMNGWI